MFHPFHVEQFLSELEHGVKYNYSESGVHPMKVQELIKLTGLDPEVILNTVLDYPQVNGSTLLREHIAKMYEAQTLRIFWLRQARPRPTCWSPIHCLSR